MTSERDKNKKAHTWHGWVGSEAIYVSITEQTTAKCNQYLIYTIKIQDLAGFRALKETKAWIWRDLRVVPVMDHRQQPMKMDTEVTLLYNHRYNKNNSAWSPWLNYLRPLLDWCRFTVIATPIVINICRICNFQRMRMFVRFHSFCTFRTKIKVALGASVRVTCLQFLGRSSACIAMPPCYAFRRKILRGVDIAQLVLMSRCLDWIPSWHHFTFNLKGPEKRKQIEI